MLALLKEENETDDFFYSKFCKFYKSEARAVEISFLAAKRVKWAIYMAGKKKPKQYKINNKFSTVKSPSK